MHTTLSKWLSTLDLYKRLSSRTWFKRCVGFRLKEFSQYFPLYILKQVISLDKNDLTQKGSDPLASQVS